MATTTAPVTLQQVLNKANLNQMMAAFRQMLLGNMLGLVKVTVTGLTAAASFDITTSTFRAASTITGLDRVSSDNLPPILAVKTLRVTAVGTGATGPRVVTDAGGTAVAPSSGIAGVALISDDGKTLTFEGTVTGFILEYIPCPAVPLSTEWASGV